MQYKLIALKSGTDVVNYSLTIPKDIVKMLGEETRFSVERSGNSIICTSGASTIPTKEEVEAFNFER